MNCVLPPEKCQDLAQGGHFYSCCHAQLLQPWSYWDRDLTVGLAPLNPGVESLSSRYSLTYQGKSVPLFPSMVVASSQLLNFSDINSSHL